MLSMRETLPLQWEEDAPLFAAVETPGACPGPAGAKRAAFSPRSTALWEAGEDKNSTPLDPHPGRWRHMWDAPLLRQQCGSCVEKCAFCCSGIILCTCSKPDICT